MHSSSADCVFGEARLISSPSTMLANTAPGRNSKLRLSWLNTLTPVTSPGSRSGVNWMRRTEQSSERARALASIVLPTPGTSSMSRWPSARSTVSAVRTTSSLPSMTVSIDSRIVDAVRTRSLICDSPAEGTLLGAVVGVAPGASVVTRSPWPRVSVVLGVRSRFSPAPTIRAG